MVGYWQVSSTWRWPVRGRYSGKCAESSRSMGMVPSWVPRRSGRRRRMRSATRSRRNCHSLGPSRGVANRKLKVMTSMVSLNKPGPQGLREEEFLRGPQKISVGHGGEKIPDDLRRLVGLPIGRVQGGQEVLVDGRVAPVLGQVLQKPLEQALPQGLDLGGLVLDAGIVIDPLVIELLELLQQGPHLGAVSHVVLVETVAQQVGHQAVDDGAVGAAQAACHLRGQLLPAHQRQGDG